MSWQPDTSAPALVDCSLEARQGVRFDLRVTERHLAYSRMKGFAISDPIETVTVERRAIQGAELTKKSPWFLRFIGLLLIAATTTAVVAFMAGKLARFPLTALLGYVLGGSCFLGSGNRWQLVFHDGKKTHKIVQPVASSGEAMSAMANALQETARLLSPRK